MGRRRGGTLEASREPTIGEDRARRAESGARGGRGVDEDALKAATRIVVGAFGSAVAGFDPERLTHREADELAGFCRRVSVETKGEGLPRDLVKAERFAANARALAERQARPELRRQAELVAELAESRGRTLTPAELDAISAVRNPSATLRDVSLPPNPGERPVSLGLDLTQLDPDERRRLEELIEKGCEAEPGSIFERAREKGRLSAQLAELAAKVAPGPRRRRLVDEAGVVALPAEIWTDLLRSSADEVWLQAEDLAVLAGCLFALETRRLPAVVMHWGGHLENDDNELVLSTHSEPAVWGSFADERDTFGARWAGSLDRLGRQQWLTVARQGQVVRVSRGPRMVAFLAKRVEVPS